MAKRGRPKGTTYDDGPYLDRIADALTRGTAKNPNAAIMTIAKDEGIQDTGLEAFRRRLHGKWHAQKDERMAAACARQEERTGYIPKVADYGNPCGDPHSAIQRAQALLERAEIKAAIQFLNSPAMKPFWQFKESPTMRTILEMQDTSIMRLLRRGKVQ